MEPKRRCSTPAGSSIGFPYLPFLGKSTRLWYGLRPGAQIPGDPGQGSTTTRPASSAWESENQRLGVGITKVANKA